jgi:hypothetical protein
MAAADLGLKNIIGIVLLMTGVVTLFNVINKKQLPL